MSTISMQFGISFYVDTFHNLIWYFLDVGSPSTLHPNCNILDLVHSEQNFLILEYNCPLNASLFQSFFEWYLNVERWGTGLAKMTIHSQTWLPRVVAKSLTPDIKRIPRGWIDGGVISVLGGGGRSCPLGWDARVESLLLKGHREGGTTQGNGQTLFRLFGQVVREACIAAGQGLFMLAEVT